MESILTLHPNRDAVRRACGFLLLMRCVVHCWAGQIDLEGRGRALPLFLFPQKLIVNFFTT
jgi:hypothetical protein